MGREYHSGLTPAEMIEVEDVAVPRARKAYDADQLGGTALRDNGSETHMDEMIGDLNGLGEVGESVYGEKADIRLLFGDGINGDFKAIIMMSQHGTRWLV